MKLAAHIVTLTLAFLAGATPAALAAPAEESGYTPLAGQRFDSALSGPALTREFQLNVAPDGTPGARTLAKPKVGELVNVYGTITNNLGASVCGLMLANGQFMFSCSPTGTYSLTAPLDSPNQITLFGFADGHFPFKTVLGSYGGRYDIVLNVATVVTPPPVLTSTLRLTITDSCHDGWAINYKFFDETNNLVWPSASSYYYTTYDDTPYSTSLSCQTGAHICYGGRDANPSNPIYWGVDIDNSKSCSSCCVTCQDGSNSWTLSCQRPGSLARVGEIPVRRAISSRARGPKS